MDFETFRQEIEDYLPIDFYNEENNTYKSYLLDALTENWENAKYQFCILATNMLFMSFLYKGFWFLIDKEVPKVDRILKSQDTYNKPENMFLLSPIKEDKFIEIYTSVFDVHPNAKREYTRLIEVRDECAHASGSVQYASDDMESKFQEYHKAIEKIFAKHKTYFINVFQKKLNEYWRSELYNKTNYEFLDGFCSKEKVSIKELLELYSFLQTITISKDADDYTQKQLSVFLIKYYLSCKAEGRIDYAIDNLKEDIFKLCEANPLENDAIACRLEDECSVSSCQLISEAELNSIKKNPQSPQITLEEEPSNCEILLPVKSIIDLSKMTKKEIAELSVYLDQLTKEEK